MKLKKILILSLLLIAIFFIAQSFYYRHHSNSVELQQSYFKGYTGHVAICGSAYYNGEDIPDIPALTGWGNYKWKITTTSDSAQFYFNQGISMYYAFHNIEAIASFNKATHFDPQCAMAWYGKSLSMGPTINYPNGYKPPFDADNAAQRSKMFMGGCTKVEQALIMAIQQRFNSDTTISVRQMRANYADAMKEVNNQFPENVDVITLYADALLILHPWDLYDHDFKPKPWTPTICFLLKKAIAICPKHPGANHYYIHSVEASATPQLALSSAHLLETLMPSVSHITHMPSHIYIRTGAYQQGVKVNESALAGYGKYLKQYSPVINGSVLYQLHNMHLRINCAQMGGNYTIAISGSDSLRAIIPLPYLSLKGADGSFFQYLYMQPVLTAVRFGKWDDVLKNKPLETLPYASVLLYFSKGLAWCAEGKLEKAELEFRMLNDKMKDAALKIPIDNFSSPFESANVASLILQGEIAARQLHYKTAIVILTKAVAAEDHLIYNEPRDWSIPARHFLGDVLLKAGKFKQAIAVFIKDLTINAKNGWALTGLQIAYQKTKNDNGLFNINQQLPSAWKIKDEIIKRPVF